jgi:cell division septation protein DedD
MPIISPYKDRMQTDSSEKPDLSEREPGETQRLIVLSFCATVLIGVLVCAGYLVTGGTRAAARATPKSKPIESQPVETHPIMAPLTAAATIPQPPQPSPQASEKPRARKEPPRAVSGGTYLQMAAVDRGVANVYVEVLSRKGFQAIVGPGPTPDIFRVLVGPLKDAATLARVKADLQDAGFTSFARKLTSE